MKIIIAGEDRESSAYIRDALIRPGLEIQLVSFDLLKNIINSDVALLILNFRDQTEITETEIDHILPFVKKFPSPIISFLQQKRIQDQKLLERHGLHPVLELPYSHSEIRILVDRTIDNSGERISEKKQKIKESDFVYPLQTLSQIMESLRETGWDFSNLVHKILLFSKNSVSVPHTLFIEEMGNGEGLVRESMSLTWLKNDLRLDLRQLQDDTISRRDMIVMEHLGKNHPACQYLKSLLGIEIRSFIICPVMFKEVRKFILLFLNEKNNEFSAKQKSLINLLHGLTEIALEKDKLTSEPISEKPHPSAVFFQGIIDHLNFGIIIIDQQLDIRFINHEASNLLQLKPDSRDYQNIRDVLGEQNTRAVIDSMHLINGAFQRPEIDIETSSGHKLLIGFTLTEYMDPLTHEHVYILSLKDITYTKELQEEMSRMDRLASLGVMASGIAHEIRNPLAGIKAIAQTFEEELSSDDPKNEYVSRIIKQVNRLDDLLKSLFSYAKPQKPNRQFYSVQEIVHDVLSLLKQKLHSQNIQLTQSFQKTLRDVFVDNSQVQQVLFNLILNSIEAMEGAGEIKITVREIRENANIFRRKPFYKKITENPYILIQISDTGCGISQDNLQQIFNPFFTTKNFGTGLGLSIVYQIVQENNGIIYFESENNVGTDCYLFLPAHEPIPKELIQN